MPALQEYLPAAPQPKHLRLPPVPCAGPAAIHLAGSHRRHAAVGSGTARAGRLYRARSRLYRSQILQENMRSTAFFKLYKICILLHRCNLKFFAKNRFERSSKCIRKMQPAQVDRKGRPIRTYDPSLMMRTWRRVKDDLLLAVHSLNEVLQTGLGNVFVLVTFSSPTGTSGKMM